MTNLSLEGHENDFVLRFGIKQTTYVSGIIGILGVILELFSYKIGLIPKTIDCNQSDVKEQ